MLRTQVQFGEEQYRKLKEPAGQQQESIAVLVRRVVNQLLLTRKPGKSTSYREAMKVVGKYQAKKTDIAVDHDRSLEESFQ